jgi:hypothetical protein
MPVDGAFYVRGAERVLALPHEKGAVSPPLRVSGCRKRCSIPEPCRCQSAGFFSRCLTDTTIASVRQLTAKATRSAAARPAEEGGIVGAGVGPEDAERYAAGGGG